MTRVHLIHGIHSAGDCPPTDLIPFLKQAAAEVLYPDYGFILGVETRLLNPPIVGAILPYIAPGDLIVGHSNGCAIAYELMLAGAPVAGAAFINPALEQDIVRPAGVRFIDVYFNPGDMITEAAKVGAELGLTATVWGEMGHAGYSGKDPAISNINCAATAGMPVVVGHSAIFLPHNLAAWGPLITKRLLRGGGP
jgi:hypothetical protein